MKLKDLEPGTFYYGPGCQVRELISLDPKGGVPRKVTYRQIHKGTSPNSAVPEIGEIRSPYAYLFAYWAKGEVSDCLYNVLKIGINPKVE